MGRRLSRGLNASLSSSADGSVQLTGTSRQGVGRAPNVGGADTLVVAEDEVRPKTGSKGRGGG